MNWGIRITLLYLGFVVLIITLVSLCMGQKVELVAKDYYAQEIRYQDRIDATNNANLLPESISHQVNGRQIDLSIPVSLITADFKGNVLFFRPSDSSKDIKMEMAFDKEGKQRITGDKLVHGMYKMQLSWQSAGKSYFKEEVIFIQ